MDYISPFTSKVNTIVGIFIALFSYFLGDHWWLFLWYLGLNVMDTLSRWIAARQTNTEDSAKAAKGIIKKVGYWLLIILSFGMSAVFIEIGKIIGVNLGITTLLGWFVLASLLVNEIRSILENLVDAGVDVPIFLIKGLEIANKAIDGTIHFDDGEDTEDLYDVDLHHSLGDLSSKKRITLEVSSKNKKVT